jgi:hypothetical protein
MAMSWAKSLFNALFRSEFSTTSPEPSTVGGSPAKWIAPADNPWGVAVLDVRAFTQGMLSASLDPQCAANAASFSGEDGACFMGVPPDSTRTSAASLRFKIEGTLFDGVLFNPSVMEHKWALYFLGGRIICVRSWHRRVVAVAETRIDNGFLEVTAIHGAFVSEDESPDYSERVLDFLVRSHVLREVYPAPLPDDIAADPSKAGAWCMSVFGSLVHFATPYPFHGDRPSEALRTVSLLHIAVARGDADAVRRQLEVGVPIDLWSSDGLCPMHWAIAQENEAMLDLLLTCGSPVDVRSSQGATPLMNAVQARSVAKVAYLLGHGADVNAADQRGFTALHRAAEMGEAEIVRLLLERGANPRPEAEGHTPRSLAEKCGHQAIVETLDSV